MRVAAAGLAALCVLLATPFRPGVVRATGAARRLPPVLLLVLVPVSALVVLHGRQLALAAIGLLTALGVHRLVARQRAARAADASSARVLDLCEALAAELAAGQPPQRVLERSAVEFPEFAVLATVARLGSDVPEALRRLSRQPGCGDLCLVGAAWQVAHRSGSGMALTLEQVASTIRERRRTARLVASELASAHATARMMAVLPLVFAVAGSGLGGDPVAFLTGTSVGLCCLGLGLALSYLGLAWLHRISDAVTGR